MSALGGGKVGAWDSPARLILAGVALIDAGVLVLLLLLGVMPGEGEERCGKVYQSNVSSTHTSGGKNCHILSTLKDVRNFTTVPSDLQTRKKRKA